MSTWAVIRADQTLRTGTTVIPTGARAIRARFMCCNPKELHALSDKLQNIAVRLKLLISHVMQVQVTAHHVLLN